MGAGRHIPSFLMAWGMRSAERRKVNVLEMTYLRSLVEVTRMNRVRN